MSLPDVLFAQVADTKVPAVRFLVQAVDFPDIVPLLRSHILDGHVAALDPLHFTLDPLPATNARHRWLCVRYRSKGSSRGRAKDLRL